jgi:hypothetical protein
MRLRGISTVVACTLAAACCALLLSSCGSSPTALGGRVLVYVSQDGTGPAPGKRVEIVGTGLTQTTNANGLALFIVRAGSHVVRAYDIGTPGPSHPFLEQSVEVQPARTSQASFNDCRYCR